MDKEIKKTVIKLASVAVFMFGFGYLLVPIYNVFCDITGLNGKTGVITPMAANSLQTDETRQVTVEFDTNVNSELPWSFTASTRKVKVRPGEIAQATFIVENLTASETFGQAVPSVTPAKGSIYFNKTECFCFSNQQLGPGESRSMTVRFVVDPGIPKDVNTLILSYTFFSIPEKEAAVSIGQTDSQNRIL